jgi:hypothetical protein
MTQPLRKWHLRIWIALAVLLPLALTVGIAGRQDTTPPNPGIRWEQSR